MGKPDDGSGTGRGLGERRDESLLRCGPRNPRGLQLAFRRVGNRVETELLADVTKEGWPGRLHSGILYTAMLEAANWTVFGIAGRIGVPVRTSALNLKRWVPTGTRLRIVGRSKTTDPKGVSVALEAVTSDGLSVAALDRDFVLPNRREFLDKMGYEEIPEAFTGLTPE